MHRALCVLSRCTSWLVNLIEIQKTLFGWPIGGSLSRELHKTSGFAHIKTLSSLYFIIGALRARFFCYPKLPGADLLSLLLQNALVVFRHYLDELTKAFTPVGKHCCATGEFVNAR